MIRVEADVFQMYLFVAVSGHRVGTVSKKQYRES